MAAVRKDNSRYLVHYAIRSSTVPTTPQAAVRIELKTVWSVLHLAAQNIPETEIADHMGLSINRVQPIVTLAELHQEKIGLKHKSPNKITCPVRPRILGDVQFFTDIEQRLIKLADANPVLFEKGIEIYLSHYNNKQGDVVFKSLKELKEAKQFLKFIRTLGYPDE